MKLYKKNKIKMIGIITAFFLSSFSIFAVPFLAKGEESKTKAISVAVGIVFWLGFLVGVILVHTMKKDRTLFYLIGENKKRKSSKIPGIVRVFQNKEAIVVDLLFLLGVLLILANFAVSYLNNYLLMGIVCITLFSFYMHCLFNGENYKYYNLVRKGDKK